MCSSYPVIELKLKPYSYRDVVPKHEEIAIGTLRGILFQAGLTVEEFLKLIGEI